MKTAVPVKNTKVAPKVTSSLQIKTKPLDSKMVMAGVVILFFVAVLGLFAFFNSKKTMETKSLETFYTAPVVKPISDSGGNGANCGEPCTKGCSSATTCVTSNNICASKSSNNNVARSCGMYNGTDSLIRKQVCCGLATLTPTPKPTNTPTKTTTPTPVIVRPTVVPTVVVSAPPLPTATPTLRACNNPGGTGLKGEYYNNSAPKSFITVASEIINKMWLINAPSFVTITPTPTNPDKIVIGVDYFGVNWTGSIVPKYSNENLKFYLTSDDLSYLYLDNKQIMGRGVSGPISLGNCIPYTIRLEYHENSGYANVKLEWEWEKTSVHEKIREVIPGNYLFPTVVSGQF